MSPVVEHGGRDAGPAPVVDASTNANPLGPSPMAREAVASCDLGPYPDPDYRGPRRRIAEHHGIEPEEVVVGAGATELIHRLVRVCGGPVLVEAATFGEYAAAARASRARLLRAADPTAFLDAIDDAVIAFVASPGNPDGRIRDAAWCDEVAGRAAAAGTTLVWDLAYAPLVEAAVPVPAGAVELHAPNKAHGCTGIRAGWLRAPRPMAERLRADAISWLCSAPGAAVLEATATADADRWVADCRPRLAAWRDELASALAGLGLGVAHGEAPFVVVEVSDAATRARRLRADHGVKVREATSLGRPGTWRLAAQPPAEQETLLAGVAAVLAERMTGTLQPSHREHR